MQIYLVKWVSASFPQTLAIYIHPVRARGETAAIIWLNYTIVKTLQQLLTIRKIISFPWIFLVRSERTNKIKGTLYWEIKLSCYLRVGATFLLWWNRANYCETEVTSDTMKVIISVTGVRVPCDGSQALKHTTGKKW